MACSADESSLGFAFLLSSGAEGDRTPDLMNAIQATEQWAAHTVSAGSISFGALLQFANRVAGRSAIATWAANTSARDQRELVDKSIGGA